MGVSGCSRESRSVPKPASPIMSRVVRLSHSRTSIVMLLVFATSMSRSQSLERSRALRQKMGVRALIDWIEKPGERAFRWCLCGFPSARRTPSPRTRTIHCLARSGLG